MTSGDIVPAPTMKSNEDFSEIATFSSAQAKFNFWLLLVGTFLIFLTVSAVAVFAIIYERSGIPQPLIGVALSIYGVGTIVAVIVSGKLSRKYGAIRMMRVGSVVMMASYISFAFTLDSFYLSVISRLLQGIGYGVFLAPAMVIAKGFLTKKKFVTLFGIYAASIPMPNIVGPSIAKWVMDSFPIELFIPLTAIPMALGLIIIFKIREELKKSDGVAQSYNQLLKNRQLLISCGLILFAGLFFGFIPSYMAAYLTERHVLLASFFSPFSLTLIAARFLIAPLIENIRHRIIVGAGIIFIGGAYLLIGAEVLNAALSVTSGIIFGIGYSLCYPRLSTMSILPFPENEREKPVAIFNAAFIFGTNFTPLGVGFIRESVSLAHILQISGIIGLLLGLFIVANRKLNF